MTRGDGDWWESAACKGTADLHIWFTNGPGKKALAVCARCPVVAPCLEEALRAEELYGGGSHYGVRGGKTGPERKRIVQKRRQDSEKP